jgi:hypothetical protein
MLGPSTRRQFDRSITVSLQSLVPVDHVYRHLERTLDVLEELAYARDPPGSGMPSTGV